MEADELAYNAFYLLLRNEHKKKYEQAVSKCWTICVPCGASLRGVAISKEFIDDHVLRPLGRIESRLRFVSTDPSESRVYEIDARELRPIADDEVDEPVRILSIEKGYNKEFQPYGILILDKPIRPEYRTTKETPRSDGLELNRNVGSYKEALEFLKALPEDRACSLDDLVTEAEGIEIGRGSEPEALQQRLRRLISGHWASTMRKQSLDLQRDARFQHLLSLSLELFVMHLLHESLYGLISLIFEQQDLELRRKIDELLDVGITPDQLGVRESLAISLPSAMVELATLDTHRGPLEKLMCLKGTLDFIVAEIKGALADVQAKSDLLNDEDELSPYNLDTDDLILLLLFIIIKCRCQRLRTDLYYLENFIWSVSPHDELSYTLVTFKAALALLETINPQDLPSRSEKVKNELKTSEYLNIAKLTEVKTPLDRQMRDLAKMLEKCTQTT